MSSPSDSNHAKHLDRISAVNQPDVEAFLTVKMTNNAPRRHDEITPRPSPSGPVGKLYTRVPGQFTRGSA